MQKIRLGATDIPISRCGFGGMSIGGSYGDVDTQQAISLVQQAVELGVTLFDTANVYGDGRSEEVLAQALHGRRDRVVLCTKGGIKRAPGAPVQDRQFDNSPGYLRKCVHESLQRLRTERIDLFYVHRRDPSIPIEAVMDGLSAMVREGKVGAIGLCEVDAAELERACRVHPVAALQSEYSLWERSVENGILEVCLRHQVTFVAYSPLGRGFLTGMLDDAASFASTDARSMFSRFSRESLAQQAKAIIDMQALAARWGCTTAQLALAWLFASHPQMAAIPGTKRSKYLLENVGAAAIHFTPEQLTEIEAVLPAAFINRSRYSTGLSSSS